MKSLCSIKIWMTLAVILGLARGAQAATVNLAWTANTETDVAGYVVLYGIQANNYTTTIDAGNHTSQQLTNLVNGTRYYIVVKAYNTSGMYSGASQEVSGIASDTTSTAPAPSAPAGPSPAVGAAGVPVTSILSWTASTNAAQYDVAFGTVNPPAVISSNQTATTYQPAALTAGTTYYWQIVAKGAGGSTSGPIWSFTTAGVAPRPVPVAAYAFNEGSGTTTADATGNGRTGTLVNATWIAAGKNGGALSFSGNASRVSVADAPALRFTSAMTLEAWINPAVPTSPYWQAIIYKGPDNYVLATPGSDTSLVAGGTIAGGLPLVNSAGTLPTNAWSHIAVTYDGAALRLFVNGALVATQAATGLIAVSTEPLEIGSSLVDGGFFVGSLDDVRVYNTALTLAQIQSDMTTPVTNTVDTQAPTIPTTLTSTAVSTTQLALTWTAATDTVGVTSYLIERCAGAGCTAFVQVGTASTTTYTDAGLVASTSYSYRVRATDAAGNLSGYSSTCSASTLTPIPVPTAPTSPAPASNATAVSSTPTLSWTSTNATQYSVAFGTVNPPAVVSSSQTATTYQPAALSAGATYYWQIVAKSAVGSTSGPVWSFTTLPLPSAPTSPAPASSATGVSLTTALSWTSAANATQYDVAFGASNPPTVVSSNQTSTTYQPAALTAGKTYYWQVVAKGAAGSASSAVWSFTTLPAPTAPSGPAPAAGAAGVSPAAVLSWTASANATQYDVAFGTTNPPSVVSSNQTSATYQPSGLTAGKTYYWQVVAKGAAGSASSAVWSFTTLTSPAAPASPSPAIGVTGVAVTTTLTWAASTNATQYDVALGTTNPPSIISSNQASTAYQPVALTASTTYYWQIVAKGAGGSTNGVVWSFTTAAAPAMPAAPTPATSSTGVSPTTPLSWAAAANATQYNVALGTTNPPSVVSSNQTATTYQPAALAAGTTYYWQIIAKGPGGSTNGPIWSLTTAVAARPAPVAAYAFNEGSGTTTADATGNGRTGTLVNATWITAGKNGGALSFSGNASRVSVADAPALRFTSAMTLEAWINPAVPTSPYWQAIIYKGPDNYVLATPGSDTSLVAGGTIAGGVPLVNSPGTLPTNAWSHIAVTYDGAALRLFVNGTLVATQAATGSIAVSTEPLEIGSSLVDGGFFVGSLDDVRVYNTALTPAQIQSDMTTPVTNTVDTQAPSTPTTLVVTAVSTTQLTLTWTASTDNVGVTGYRVERCAGAGCSAFSQVGAPSATTYGDTGLIAATSYTYRVRATDAAGNLSSYSSPISVTTPAPVSAPATPAGPTPATGSVGVSLSAALSWAASANATQYNVALGTTNPPSVVSSNQTATTYQPAALAAGTTYYWQIIAKGPGGSTNGPIWSLTTAVAARPAPVAAYAFNEGSGTTTADATGNGRTGTLVNATWITAGKNGGALSFSGNASRVSVADAPALRFTSAMTLEAWINPAVPTSPYWQAIIYKGPDNYVLATPGSDTSLVAGGTIAGGVPLVNSPGTLPTNAWSHIAVTYDGAALRLFVNGTLVATQAATGSIAVSTEPLEIGSSLVDGGFFVGSLDDVRVYNTALTPAQIQSDMTTPVTNAAQSAAPATPSGPVPANGASSVLTTIALNWTASTNAVQYDVALGTTNPPPTVATNLATTFYQPASAFTNGMTYYWRVTAKGAGGTTAGPVWSFTAQAVAAAGLAAQSVTSTSPAQTLRLMTWNVNGGNNPSGVPSVDAQVALMVSSGAQVIALQGVTISTVGDLSALYESKLENATSRTWNTLWIPDPRLAPANPEGNLFLTTLPIAGSATTDLDSAPLNGTLLDAKRSAGWIGVIVNNVTVHIATTQLAVDPTQRAAQMTQLGSWISNVPAPRLIGGDFNMLPADASYRQMANSFSDAWTALVNTGNGGTTQNAPAPGGRVDYWWSELNSQHISPSAITVLQTSSSSHNAVVVDVNVQ